MDVQCFNGHPIYGCWLYVKCCRDECSIDECKFRERCVNKPRNRYSCLIGSIDREQVVLKESTILHFVSNYLS